MSNIQLIIEERATPMGNFLVGRLLPFRQKRMVGPFIFIDHMGPAALGPDEQFDVPPHPHIGLSTLTYLFEGEIMHRDSLGTQEVITPGEVNWMTAGKGIVHSERTPDHLRDQPKQLHGLQIWIALPISEEQSEPSFFHLEKEDVPRWKSGGVAWALIAGEAMGRTSAVPVHSRLYLIELRAEHNAKADLTGLLYGESGLYILKGAVSTEGQRFGEKQILVAQDAGLCTFEMEAGTVVFLFGGDPFPEERFIDWNFVASDRLLLERARERWEANEFPSVPGETERVPYPNRKIQR